MNLLKQSTAATIKLGPFIDDSDGKTAETGLTISQADIRLSKNGSDFAQTHNSAGATHDEFGYYDIPLDTTDTNTLGRLRVAVSESGALPVWQDFLVVTANVYDTLCSTDTFDVNVATIATDSITAAALKADAVTEIVTGIWGADLSGYGDGEAGSDLLYYQYQTYLDLVNGGRLDLLIDSIITHLTQIKGTGWTNETLAKIVTDIAAISAGSGAMPQQIWEYATRVLTAGTNIDLSSLATATDLATLDGKVDAILEDTGTTLDTLVKDIPTNAELATALGTADDAVLAAVAAAKAVIDDLHDTDIPAIPTAAEVWSSPIRTLTVPAVVASSNVDGTTLSLYKDADINIEFTGLTIPAGSKKVVFTIKDNLDDADTASALQATYQLVAPSTETHTLNYINSAVPTGLTNPVTFTVDTDSVEFDMTAAAAYYLPRYERGYLHWDLKLITATTVQILQQGLVQILGTSTRAVA